MKVNHAWNKQPRTVPKLVPLPQVEAAVTIASHNTAAFTAQMVMEQMMLMLHEDFGFGRVRAMRALDGIQKRLTAWEQDVNQEFNAETFRMNYKQKLEYRTELAWTWEKHDAALQPLMDPAVWKPYTERYKGFGGTGSWCKE